MDKILWVKFGWSDFYSGGPVDGNFSFLNNGGEGHEAWNFRPAPDGRYYCNTVPQGGSRSAPYHADLTGWTVVFLSKMPKKTGIHIVGWYENARLEGEYIPHPYSDEFPTVGELHYTISSKKAYLVPPDDRIIPFSHQSVRTGRYSFIAGPNIDDQRSKDQIVSRKAVLKTIKSKLLKLRKVAIGQPTPETVPNIENELPIGNSGFGSHEHRKKVEIAAINYVCKHFKKREFEVVSRERENLGWDLDVSKDGKIKYRLEVKGTSGSSQQFFLTANEKHSQSVEKWRLAIVVNALSKNPTVEIYTPKKLDRHFDFEPLAYHATPKNNKS